VNESSLPERGPTDLKLRPEVTERAIEELKRRGKESWGAIYYSQLAPLDLCRLAGRAHQVQYGALISWLKRLDETPRAVPIGAIELVAHLVNVAPDDSELTTHVARGEASVGRRSTLERLAQQDSKFEVNCPSVVHDYRFVVVGELPRPDLHPAVFVQPQDGTGYWYPQVARHNPLRAGRAFACFVQLGNPVGIWHVKRPPLDAKVRVFALENAWSTDLSERLHDEELTKQTALLGVVGEKDTLTCRISTDPLAPSLRDSAAFAEHPIMHHEPRAIFCAPPLILDWKGGATYVEIRDGEGDQLLFQGTAAPGMMLTLRAQDQPADPTVVLYEFVERGRYRVRLYPGIKSFVDPMYEWWIELA